MKMFKILVSFVTYEPVLLSTLPYMIGMLVIYDWYVSKSYFSLIFESFLYLMFLFTQMYDTLLQQSLLHSKHWHKTHDMDNFTIFYSSIKTTRPHHLCISVTVGCNGEQTKSLH